MLTLEYVKNSIQNFNKNLNLSNTNTKCFFTENFLQKSQRSVDCDIYFIKKIDWLWIIDYELLLFSTLLDYCTVLIITIAILFLIISNMTWISMTRNASSTDYENWKGRQDAVPIHCFRWIIISVRFGRESKIFISRFFTISNLSSLSFARTHNDRIKKKKGACWLRRGWMDN